MWLFSSLWEFTAINLITLVGIKEQRFLVSLFHSRAMWQSNEYQKVLIFISLPHEFKEIAINFLNLLLFSYFYVHGDPLFKVSNGNSRKSCATKLAMLTPKHDQLDFILPLSSVVFRVGSDIFIIKFTLNWEKCLLGKYFNETINWIIKTRVIKVLRKIYFEISTKF